MSHPETTQDYDEEDLEALEKEMTAADRAPEVFTVPYPASTGTGEGQRPLPTTLKEAHECLEELQRWRDQSKRDGNYLGLPEWQFLGALHGITGEVETVSQASSGCFLSRALLHMAGRRLTRAFGLALSTEKIQGRVLANASACGLSQTRAMARAYANLFRWIAVLGGFEQTPAEEMPQAPDEASSAIPTSITTVSSEERQPLGRGPNVEEKAVAEDLKRGDGVVVFCEKCGKKMVERSGKNGKFIACSGFPNCRNTRSVGK